jgi:hypothetical protein
MFVVVDMEDMEDMEVIMVMDMATVMVTVRLNLIKYE